MKKTILVIILALTSLGLFAQSNPPDPTDPCTNCPPDTNGTYYPTPSYNFGYVNPILSTNLEIQSFLWNTNDVMSVSVTNTDTNSYYTLLQSNALPGFQSITSSIGSLKSTTYNFSTTNGIQFVEARKEPGFIIYTTNIVADSGYNDCASGNTIGYAYFYKTGTNFGWVPTSGVTNQIAEDVTRTNTVISYFDEIGESSCSFHSPLFFDAPTNFACQFVVYFTNSLPTGIYALHIVGFNP